MNILKTSFRVLIFFTVLTGGIYPLLITGLSQTIFPVQANGSLLEVDNRGIVGSSLIGQEFTSPRYFWGRLSATASQPYNALASAGTNYSVLNDALAGNLQARVLALNSADAGTCTPIPIDLVTSSASGLDPHISAAAVHCQIPRVAKARGLSENVVRALVLRYTETPVFGIFGETRVNVLMLNLALDGYDIKYVARD